MLDFLMSRFRGFAIVAIAGSLDSQRLIAISFSDVLSNISSFFGSNIIELCGLRCEVEPSLYV